MSSRNFNRWFKSATGLTVVKYIQMVRVKAAKQQLENSKLSFNEIANRIIGLSPVDYRKNLLNYKKTYR